MVVMLLWPTVNILSLEDRLRKLDVQHLSLHSLTFTSTNLVWWCAHMLFQSVKDMQDLSPCSHPWSSLMALQLL